MDTDGNTIHLGRAAQRRATVLNQVLAGELTNGQATNLLGVSVRHLKRVRAAYQREGPASLVHGNTGRTPWHALPAAVQARVLELAVGRYAGLNYQHLTEKLAAEGLTLDPSTVRRLLLGAGLRGPRTRRAPAHRSRRERLPREGLLLQGDGSRHRWLGDTRPYLTLIGFIDDATGTVPAAAFRAQEDAAGYLIALRQIVCTKGLPTAVYVDRHGIFQRSRREPLTLEEELAGGPLPTQVGRALAELDIRLILAQSPQAKGRIERLWGTLQDRLVAELRLADIATLDDANTFLPGFLDAFNSRFAVPATEPGSAYRPVPATFEPDRIFCFKYERVVQPDNTVSFFKQVLQLQPSLERANWVRARVEVHEHLDGSLAVAYQGQVLASMAAPSNAPTLRARHGPRPGAGAPQPPTPFPSRPAPSPSAPRPPSKPAADHPWRRSMTSRRPLSETDQ